PPVLDKTACLQIVGSRIAASWEHWVSGTGSRAHSKTSTIRRQRLAFSKKRNRLSEKERTIEGAIQINAEFHFVAAKPLVNREVQVRQALPSSGRSMRRKIIASPGCGCRNKIG